MQQVYPLLRQADIIVMGTPVYFYGATAQLKSLIDRSQALWARKYVYKLDDPGRKWREGYLLSVGATQGKDLFEGITLTAKYFFDAVGSNFKGSLTFRKIEGPDDVKRHSSALKEAEEAARRWVTPFLKRKKILFLCTENACRSQMAGAFARFYAGDRIEALTAGSAPATEVNPVMVETMKEKGIDMAFLAPKSIEAATQKESPDLIVTMGCGDVCPMYPGVKTIAWDLQDPGKKPLEFMRTIRDQVEQKVKDLIEPG
jgi:protein-tyrosine-phosphatase